MTVCIAALANGLIVCIADKALTYGDKIQWDADSSKITSLDNNKSLILMDGDEGLTDRVLRKLNYLTQEWSGDRIELIIQLEKNFKEAFAEEQELCVLHPEMMTREDYIKAISGPEVNAKLYEISARISDFKNVFNCLLLVCGFDKDNIPYIIRLETPGIATDISNVGFGAIGVGMEKATSGLLFAEYKRSNGISRTMYDCYDAKLHAEMAPGVGYEWEMRLITRAGAVPLRDEAKSLLDSIWLKYNRSPFEKRKKDDFPNPPRDWQMRLRNMVAASLQQCEPDAVRSADEIAEGRVR